MAFKFAFVFTSAFIFCAACTKSKEDHVEEYHGLQISVREQGADFKVPSQVWDQLLADPSAKLTIAQEKAQENGEGLPAMPTANLVYSSIEVILKEKTRGTLQESEIRLSLPDGGGEIDLARWTTGKTGSFYVNFKAEGLLEDNAKPHVAFYSRSKKRKVGDQVVGSGCQSFMDLTQAYLNGQKDGGWIVNTTRNFHSTVLGGHFLFSWEVSGTRRVTRVTFLDSKNPSLKCENEK